MGVNLFRGSSRQRILLAYKYLGGKLVRRVGIPLLIFWGNTFVDIARILLRQLTLSVE